MSEMYNGPLDIVRQKNNEAIELDFEAAKLITDEDSFEVVRSVVHALDEGNPIMGQEVVVYGDVITARELDGGKKKRLELPPKDTTLKLPLAKTVRIRGVYRGFSIRGVYDAEWDQTEYRVLHMVNTGTNRVIYGDDVGYIHDHSIQQNSYILIPGSEVVPELPLNAHSFDDLKEDEMIEDLAEIAFREFNTKFEVVKDLSAFTNEALMDKSHEEDMNHQRISYLNSLGLLVGARLLTRDLFVGDKDELETLQAKNPEEEIKFNDPSNLGEVTPEIFELARGYEWVDDKKILFRETVELYIKGTAEVGQRVRSVLVPLKSIVDIH